TATATKDLNGVVRDDACTFPSRFDLKLSSTMAIARWTETREMDTAAMTPQQLDAVRRAASSDQGEKMKHLQYLDRTLANSNSTGPNGWVADRKTEIVEN